MFSKYHNILVLDTPNETIVKELLHFEGSVFSLKYFSEFPTTILDFSVDQQKAVYDKVSAKVLAEAHFNKNGKSLTERLVFDENHSLWHYAKFRVFHSMVSMELLKSKIQCVPLENQKSLLVISDRSIPIDDLEPNEISFHRASEKLNSKSTGIGNLVKLGFQFLKNGISNWGKISLITKAKYLFLYDRSMIQYLTVDGESKGFFNPVLSYLEQNRTEKSAIILDFQLPKNLSGNALETPFKAINSVKSEAVLLKGIIKIFPVLKTIALSKELKSQLEEWKTNGGNSFIYNEINDNWNYFKFHLFRYHCYQGLFSTSNEVAITRDENNPFARAFWQAGETKGLLSIGNQHGAIAEHSAAYLSNKNDHHYSSFPQMEFVWGEKWKSTISSKFELPVDRMAVVGQLRTDVLKKIIDKQEEKNQFVLYATQPIPNKSLLEQVDKIAFESIKNSPNEQFVLKPHPKQIGKKLFQKFENLPNCTIQEKEDLYVLLSKAKATITAFSTVGAETVFFNIPLLTIDPLKQDIAGYSAEGIAQTCSTSEELTTQIELLNTNAKTMTKNYKEFTSLNFLKIDGKVADRTWNEIENRLIVKS